MRLLPFRFACCALVFGSLSAFAATQYVPEPIDSWNAKLGLQPWSSTGMVRAKVGRENFYGSGAVARDSRLIYGCAHVVYDRGVWASKLDFARAYSDRRTPKDWSPARGFHLLEGYLASEEFDSDFSVAYSPASFGPFLPLFGAGAGELLEKPTVLKMILGYPSYRDYDYVSGYNFQHQTGPFYRPFTQTTGAYYSADDVSTGPGNSGGPVLVESGGIYRLAGILVSGSELPPSAGIYVLGSAAESAASDALADSENGTPTTVVARTPLRLKDGSSKYRAITFSFRKTPPYVTAVRLALSFAAQPGEVEVFLEPPGGGRRTVVSPIDSSTWSRQNNYNIDLTDKFAGGMNGEGKWRLYCRDVKTGAPAVLDYAALTVSSN